MTLNSQPAVNLKPLMHSRLSMSRDGLAVWGRMISCGGLATRLPGLSAPSTSAIDNRAQVANLPYKR